MMSKNNNKRDLLIDQHLLQISKKKRRLPMASVENKNIVKVSDADPFICRNINIHLVYSL